MEVNLSERQFDVGVSGGAKQTGLRAKIYHQAGHWLLSLDCSNSFNTVKWAAALDEVATRAPALACFLVKCHGITPADVVFQMDTRKWRAISSNTGVHQGDVLGAAPFCMPGGTILRKVRIHFEPEGDKAIAYMDHISLAYN